MEINMTTPKHPPIKVTPSISLNIKDANGNPQTILVNQLPEHIQQEVVMYDYLSQERSDAHYAKFKAELAVQAQGNRVIGLVSQHFSPPAPEETTKDGV